MMNKANIMLKYRSSEAALVYKNVPRDLTKLGFVPLIMTGKKS